MINTRTILAVILLSATVLGGCGGFKPLRIAPSRPNVPAVEPRFTQAAYRVDRDQTYHFILWNATTGRGGGNVEQVLIMRVFWRPVGGKTSLNPDSVNATFRYLVMTPTAVAQYEGAGFVRLEDKPGAEKMDARIVSGDLVLSESTAAFNDTLGRARITGSFSARHMPLETAEKALAARREFFLRTFELSRNLPREGDNSPETAPADTQSATQPGAK